MPFCLTIFDQFNEDILAGHAHYCREYGYDHRWLTAERIGPVVALRRYWKYSQILAHLRGLDEGDLLLFLDGDSAIYRPVALEALMEGRDVLAIDAPRLEDRDCGVMTNMFVFRNTPASRQLVFDLISDASQVIALIDARQDESRRFAPAHRAPFHLPQAGRCVNVSWRIVEWWKAQIFVVCLAPLPIVRPDGEFLEDMLHDMNLQRLLARQIKDALLQGRPVLESPQYPALPPDAVTIYRSRKPIAFVTLYTYHIKSYAQVAEHNARRYCAKHGYDYIVYREVPGELGENINGTWVKSWLILRHLADYDWVIWIDADTIFYNQSIEIDGFLNSRDVLFTKDVGTWTINAGLLGFRNTDENRQMLESLWAEIDLLEDKSTVYVNSSDQSFTCVALEQRNWTGEAFVQDNSVINTPPLLAAESPLLIHFINLGEPFRGVYMADFDERSKRLWP